MQVASSLWPKARRLPDEVVSRGEQGTTEGKGETMTGTGWGKGKGTRTSARISTRAGMGVRTEPATGTRIYYSDGGGGEKKPGNLRSGNNRGNRGGSEDAKGGSDANE